MREEPSGDSPLLKDLIRGFFSAAQVYFGRDPAHVCAEFQNTRSLSSSKEIYGKIDFFGQFFGALIVEGNRSDFAELCSVSPRDFSVASSNEAASGLVELLNSAVGSCIRSLKEIDPHSTLLNPTLMEGQHSDWQGEMTHVEVQHGRAHFRFILLWDRRRQSVYHALQEAEEHRDQLKQMQAKLVQAEKLQSLSMLVSGVAHEMNTPLGIGISLSSHLKEQCQGLERDLKADTLTRKAMDDFLEDSHEELELLESNLARISRLVNKFKQISLDQHMESLRRFDLRLYLDECLLGYGAKLKQKAQVRVQVLGSSELELTSFPAAWAQVFEVLLSNSLEHAFVGRSEGCIEISLEERDAQLHMSFKDDGLGISSAHKSQIFDPFFTTNRGAGSTGLGLNVLHNIVTGLLQGEMTLVDDEASGCHWSMVFPLELKQA